MFETGEIPMELMIQRVCQKYNKLPSEVLGEEWSWIEKLIMIDTIDSKKTRLEENRAKLKAKGNGRH